MIIPSPEVSQVAREVFQDGRALDVPYRTPSGESMWEAGPALARGFDIATHFLGDREVDPFWVYPSGPCLLNGRWYTRELPTKLGLASWSATHRELWARRGDAIMYCWAPRNDWDLASCAVVLAEALGAYDERVDAMAAKLISTGLCSHARRVA